MLAMVSGGLALGSLADTWPDDPVYQTLRFHTTHVEWAGCSFWDLIQPSFMFMVGVAMVFSYGKRQELGQCWERMFCHVLWRSFLLIVLGLILRSNNREETYWTLEDVIQQIGLGYPFLFLLWRRKPVFQWSVLVLILVGYWALFAFSTLPPDNYDYVAVNVDPEDKHFYHGFYAHWNKNANPAHYADVWLLNQFPREAEFVCNKGGYNTLNFIPSLATMIFGLMTGQLLRSEGGKGKKFLLMLLGGLVFLGIGYALHEGGVCPVVKRIWTPAWAIYSTGWALIMLSAFYLIMDLIGMKFLGWIFMVVGMNSIAIYCMNKLITGWLMSTWIKHFGEGVFHLFGDPYVEIMKSALELIMLWLICFWMYRNKFFVRI